MKRVAASRIPHQFGALAKPMHHNFFMKQASAWAKGDRFLRVEREETNTGAIRLELII